MRVISIKPGVNGAFLVEVEISTEELKQLIEKGFTSK